MVIVTALFDIERDKWDNFTMSYHTYLTWMKNTLSIDQNMVVYTEEKFFKEIFDMRKEVDPKMKKTKIIVTTVEKLTGYKLWYNRIETLMNSDKFKRRVHFKDVPEMCKPLYNMIMFNKVYFIKDTIENGLFPSDSYMWLDAACFRDDQKNFNIKWPVKKLNKTTFFSHHDKISIEDKFDHVMSQMRFIQGGCFVIRKKDFEEFRYFFELTLDYLMKKGYIGSDEKILDLVYLNNSSTYDLIKCNWREYFEKLL